MNAFVGRSTHIAKNFEDVLDNIEMFYNPERRYFPLGTPMLRLAICSAFFVLILTACAVGLPKQEPKIATPTWVINPPKDNESTMWGLGEGGDLDSAKRFALEDIAAKLHVAISAQLKSRVTVNSNSVDKYASTSVTEDVHWTEFKNYVLEKAAPSTQGFFALVSVDRQAFIVDAERKLVEAENEMAICLVNSETGNAIEKFVAQQRALPWIEKAVASAQALSAANASFDSDRLRKNEAALAKAKAAASKLTFDIRVTGENNDVAQTVASFLNDFGIRVGRGGTPLVIDAISTQEVIFGSNTVQMRVVLRVLDEKGLTLSSQQLTAHGSSMTDNQMARQAALKDLRERLRDVGPLATLGFKSS